ncbi:MAG: TenA family protein [Pseudonocardiaceae bacterium]
MLHEHLQALAEPVLRKVTGHPFWSGIRDGSLPPESLTHFVEQDTGFLLPAYARALARCAAMATDDAHVALLGRSITGTLGARDRLRTRYAELAGQFGAPPPRTGPAGAGPPAVDPGTCAHAAFFQAASARSAASGVGALLPMVWFNLHVSDDLRHNHHPGSRYAPWIEAYHPGADYRHAVHAFLTMADELDEQLSVAGRQELVENFVLSTRYEWLFAETSWTRPQWPV